MILVMNDLVVYLFQMTLLWLVMDGVFLGSSFFW